MASKARELADVIGTQDTTENVLQGRKNLIINGAMQVAQRGTSVTGQTGTDGYYTIDRWKSQTDTGTWTLSQDTDAPNGFANSYKFQCTSAGTSNADEIAVKQYLEGQDLQQLAYGTSDAKSLTISFWVKCSQTGTFAVGLLNQNSSQLRAVNASLTINTADTWEYKTVTFAGDTSYGFENGNTRELDIQWTFGAASTWTSGTFQTTWGNYVQANQHPSGIMGLGGSTSDYFNITGVQLEVGSVATPFEHRSYGEELALCQRYFATNSGGGTGLAWFFSPEQLGSGYGRTTIFYPVEMRANPTISNLTYYNSSYSLSGAQNSLNRQSFTAWLNGMTSSNELYSWSADAEL